MVREKLNFDGGTHSGADVSEDEIALNVIDEACPGEDALIDRIDALREMERLASKGARLPKAIRNWIAGKNVPLETVLH